MKLSVPNLFTGCLLGVYWVFTPLPRLMRMCMQIHHSPQVCVGPGKLCSRILCLRLINTRHYFTILMILRLNSIPLVLMRLSQCPPKILERCIILSVTHVLHRTTKPHIKVCMLPEHPGPAALCRIQGSYP